MKTSDSLFILGVFLLTSISAGNCLAIGPKPDDPRAANVNRATEIGPKPDDPKAMNNSTIRAIGPKPDDPKASQGAVNGNTTGQEKLSELNSGKTAR